MVAVFRECVSSLQRESPVRVKTFCPVKAFNTGVTGGHRGNPRYKVDLMRVAPVAPVTPVLKSFLWTFFRVESIRRANSTHSSRGFLSVKRPHDRPARGERAEPYEDVIRVVAPSNEGHGQHVAGYIL